MPLAFAPLRVTCRGGRPSYYHGPMPHHCHSDPAAFWRERNLRHRSIVDLQCFNVIDPPKGMPLAFAPLRVTCRGGRPSYYHGPMPHHCHSDPAAFWRERNLRHRSIVDLQCFNVIDPPKGLPLAFAPLRVTCGGDELYHSE